MTTDITETKRLRPERAGSGSSIIDLVALLVLAPPEGPFGFVFVRATDLARQGHSRAPGG